MWNKIYLILLAVAVVIAGVVTFLAYNNLNSSGFAPATIVENYNYFANYDWIFLWISTVILLVVANVILWKSRKSWALWATLVYFAISVIVQKFWLAQTLFHFQQENRLTDNFLSLSPFLAITFIVLLAIIVFFDQFLVKRLHDKMYLPAESVESLPESNSIDENAI